jgi:hypothetical protein
VSEHPHPWVLRGFAVAAVIGVGGWLLLLAVWGWWMLQPAHLPDIHQPIAVLNPGHEVAIGTPVVLRLEVTKSHELNPVRSTRLLECESGNLVTMTPLPPQNLPVGTYRVIADDLIVPAKVTPGDTCRATFVITFKVNPVRDEVARYTSQPFTVLPAAEEMP